MCEICTKSHEYAQIWRYAQKGQYEAQFFHGQENIELQKHAFAYKSEL